MQNIHIQFNSAIIKKLKSLQFQTDQIGTILFILFSLYENQISLLDEFDDFNLQKRIILLYRTMEMRGLLIKNTDVSTKDAPHYHLSTEGVELVEFIKGEFKTEVNSAVIINADGTSMQQTASPDEVESWIENWVDLFPRGVKTLGKLVRSDRVSCLRKMKVFLNEFGYDRDTIMEATRRYVEFKAQDGYNFMRCAVYFIYRVDKPGEPKNSDLASWCDQVIQDRKDGKTESTENNLEYMV